MGMPAIIRGCQSGDGSGWIKHNNTRQSTRGKAVSMAVDYGVTAARIRIRGFSPSVRNPPSFASPLAPILKVFKLANYPYKTISTVFFRGLTHHSYLFAACLPSSLRPALLAPRKSPSRPQRMTKPAMIATNLHRLQKRRRRENQVKRLAWMRPVRTKKTMMLLREPANDKKGSRLSRLAQ